MNGDEACQLSIDPCHTERVHAVAFKVPSLEAFHELSSREGRDTKNAATRAGKQQRPTKEGVATISTWTIESGSCHIPYTVDGYMIHRFRSMLLVGPSGDAILACLWLAPDPARNPARPPGRAVGNFAHHSIHLGW